MKKLTDKQKSAIGTKNACKIAHLLTDEERIKFVTNCNAANRDNPMRTNDPFFEDGDTSAYHVINFAFTWANTIEGHEYWNAIEHRVLKALN